MTSEDVAKEFGDEVALLVDGVTKLTQLNYQHDKIEVQAENLRKMFLAMAKDIRVILIKLADRLHNMRTIGYVREEKRRETALETLEIYAPIAHRLGIRTIKEELEDRAIICLDPVAYKEIEDYLNSQSASRKEFLDSIIEKIKERVDPLVSGCKVEGRIKSVHGIYRKMYIGGKTFDEIYDIYAVRIIVESVIDCYNCLGVIHDMFRPIPNRFKDYISTPKPNMYQSLHTTVIGKEGIPFEVQIRTWEMHQTAEYGIAAHWKYKLGGGTASGNFDKRLAWIRQMLESQSDSEDVEDIVRTIKSDLVPEEVFVFTPKGDVINLPAGATPIDFAYAIHSGVGNSMVGASVNGRIVTFDHVLQNGDIVEVRTSKSAPGPSRDWLQLAKSSSARTKIKQWFKKEKREENVQRGRDMFDAELRRNGLTMADVMDEEVLPHILKKLSVPSMDELYAAIGYGGQTAVRSVNRVKDELAHIKRPEKKTVLDKINEQAEKRTARPQKAVHGVLVEGIDNCLIKFSKCCTPVPGDDIVGFITRGNGVSIHRTDCQNYLKQRLATGADGRWIDVSWADSTTDLYITTLRILAKERSGLIMDIATVLNALNAKVRSLSARDVGNDQSTAAVTVEVKTLDELKVIINRIAAIRGVIEVRRASS